MIDTDSDATNSADAMDLRGAPDAPDGLEEPAGPAIVMKLHGHAGDDEHDATGKEHDVLQADAQIEALKGSLRPTLCHLLFRLPATNLGFHLATQTLNEGNHIPGDVLTTLVQNGIDTLTLHRRQRTAQQVDNEVDGLIASSLTQGGFPLGRERSGFVRHGVEYCCRWRRRSRIWRDRSRLM